MCFCIDTHVDHAGESICDGHSPLTVSVNDRVICEVSRKFPNLQSRCYCDKHHKRNFYQNFIILFKEVLDFVLQLHLEAGPLGSEVMM